MSNAVQTDLLGRKIQCIGKTNRYRGKIGIIRSIITSEGPSRFHVEWPDGVVDTISSIDGHEYSLIGLEEKPDVLTG